jgi:L-threonylcarbamoyladenylate synthase
MISLDIDKAAELLRHGNVVAIPTETVYGLAANIFHEQAVGQIFTLKKRPLFNPLIVHIGHVEALSTLTHAIPDVAMELANTFWPGPLTLLLEKKSSVPDLITAGKKTVAVRMPSHPTALALLNQLDFPLAAPSANPFSRISPTSAEQVDAYFGNEIPMVLDGGICSSGIESTIIGFPEGLPTLYRFGALSHDLIETVTGPLVIHTQADQGPEAPGMLMKHYAPRTPSYLTDDVSVLLEKMAGKKLGCLLFNTKLPEDAIDAQMTLSASGDLAEAARRLYACLHWLDQQGVDAIILEAVPDLGLGRSINDRLQRASSI